MIRRQTISLNWGRFGAILDTDNVDAQGRYSLTLVLRVFLDPNGGARAVPWSRGYYCGAHTSTELCLDPVVGYIDDSDGRSFWVEDWPLQEWNEYCEIYQRQGQEFWTDRFYLSSSIGSGSGADAASMATLGTRVRTTHGGADTEVQCKFRLILTRNREQAHTSINVYNLESSASEGRRDFRSNSLNYQDVDLISRALPLYDIDPNLVGRFTNQRTFIHEIGHSLGLEHVGVSHQIPGCYTNWIWSPFENHNGTICYGNDYLTAMNVMGRGETLSWHEALPWRTAIAELTRSSIHSWQIHQIPIRSEPVHIDIGSVVFDDESEPEG